MQVRFAVARCCCDGVPPEQTIIPIDSDSWETDGTAMGNERWVPFPAVPVPGGSLGAVGFGHDTEAGFPGTGYSRWSGWARFVLPYTQGTVISTAVLRVFSATVSFADRSDPGGNPTDDAICTIACEDIDDAPARYGNVAAWNAASRTTATVPMSIQRDQVSVGAAFDTPNFAASVNEVLARPGWQAGR